MKDFNELTKEELYALSSDEIEKYKKLTLAEKGIQFVGKPTMPKNVEKQPSKEVYLIDGLSGNLNEVCFEDINEARAFINFLQKLKTIGYKSYKSDVDYYTYFFQKGLPLDYSGNEQKLSIRVETVYTKEEFDKLSVDILRHRKELDEYSSAMSAYRIAADKAKCETQFIDDAISSARDDIDRKKMLCHKFVFDYMPLADGNIDVAMRFLDKAYIMNEEEKDYVMAHIDD